MSYVCSAWGLLNMTFAVLRWFIAAYPLYSISPKPLHPWCLATRLAGVGGEVGSQQIYLCFISAEQ